MLRRIALVSMLFTVPFAAANESQEVKALKKDMPQDVALVIDRIVECNHWNGEEPSTKERAEQVKKEMEKWSCATLVQDQANLTKRYPSNYEIKTRIQSAQNIF
jgi:KaiC/GvpD/RAD55 family RecA-like ATPase